MVGELEACNQVGVVRGTSNQERQLVSEIAQIVRPSVDAESQVSDLNGLMTLLIREIRFISEYVNRRIFGENPNYEGVFLGVEDLKHICNVTVATYLAKPGTTVYFLLDEFENLLDFQKLVTNSILKASESGHYSVKISTKKAAMTTSMTLEGQEVEEPHDYSSVDVDYNISNDQERRNYKHLLTTICSRILSHEGFSETEINKLLASPLEWDGLEEGEIDNELTKVFGDRTLTTEDRHRLGYAAVYRLHHQRRRGRKQFAGFDDLVALSSGIIRLFLELAGLSYHFAVQEGTNVKRGNPIGRDHQTSAAYALSNYYLSTIRTNVATVGPQMQQLVIDLGDIFRAKLLKPGSTEGMGVGGMMEK